MAGGARGVRAARGRPLRQPRWRTCSCSTSAVAMAGSAWHPSSAPSHLPGPFPTEKILEGPRPGPGPPLLVRRSDDEVVLVEGTRYRTAAAAATAGALPPRVLGRPGAGGSGRARPGRRRHGRRGPPPSWRAAGPGGARPAAVSARPRRSRPATTRGAYGGACTGSRRGKAQPHRGPGCRDVRATHLIISADPAGWLPTQPRGWSAPPRPHAASWAATERACCGGLLGPDPGGDGRDPTLLRASISRSSPSGCRCRGRLRGGTCRRCGGRPRRRGGGRTRSAQLADGVLLEVACGGVVTPLAHDQEVPAEVVRASQPSVWRWMRIGRAVSSTMRSSGSSRSRRRATSVDERVLAGGVEEGVPVAPRRSRRCWRPDASDSTPSMSNTTAGPGSTGPSRQRQWTGSTSLLGGRLGGPALDLLDDARGRRAWWCRRAPGPRPRRAAGGA